MKRRSPKDYLSYFAPAFVLTLAGFVIAYQFVDPAPPRRITIATGQPSGAYYEMGQKYSRILARDGVTLEVKSTTGSKENLNLLAEEGSGVDIIFMQGGVGHTGHSGDLVSLGSIYYEPLWVFYRADQAIKCLKDFRGKRVSVGIEGSGTKVLAQQLLFLNNVTSKNSLFLSLKDVDAVEKLLVGEIDAAFFVVAYRGHAGRKLFDSPDIRLHDFRRGAAYAAHYHFLSLLTLPEGAIDFVKNIPSEDMTLLAPTAQLVARRNLHPALIDLLLMAAREVGSPSGFFERRGDFPSPKFTDFPLSSEAE
jgi:TRAP transporter TAXI family solute receptor